MSSKPRRNALSRFAHVWGTLAFRLTASYALAGLLLVSLATLSLYVVLVAELDRSTDEFLKDKVNVVRTMLREQPEDTEGLHEEIELESASRRYEQFYISLLDEQGRSRLMTPGMADQLDLSRLAVRLATTHGAPGLTFRGRHGRSFRVVQTTVVPEGPSGRPVTIQVAVDISGKEELLRRFRLWFWFISAGLLVLFPFVGYQIARQGIRPVEEIARTARRITSTHLDERIATAGYPYELASLAHTFNRMLDGLQDSFERISRFSADIAHDLRTPVNNIRGEAEVALARGRTIHEYREALESSLEEAVHLSDLISNLLFLARTESPFTHLQLDRLNVSRLLEGVRDYYDASASDAGVVLTTASGDVPTFAALDRALMQRAIGNLVANAVLHTPEGGRVVLTSRAQDEYVLIEVADTGVGILRKPCRESSIASSASIRRARKLQAALDWGCPSCRASCSCITARWTFTARPAWAHA